MCLLILFCCHSFFFFFFFFNDTATTEIYTLSTRRSSDLHRRRLRRCGAAVGAGVEWITDPVRHQDRKSIRLNSSHPSSSYAAFCLKKNIVSDGRNHLCGHLCPRLHPEIFKLRLHSHHNLY